jgi:two-component system response regulator AtoC
VTGPTTTLRIPRAHLDAPLHLVVLLADSTRTHRLPPSGTLVLGRDDDADITLRDDSVSRRHAELSVSPEGVVVRDLGSKNGTFVGTVEAKQAVEVLPGSAMRLGEVTILLQEGPGGVLRGPTGREAWLDVPVGAVSDAMVAVHRAARCVAADDITVLLLGETGVGKEVTAERIHALSPRASAPFVRVHCAAITESLFESELFGHERGAFTGAIASRAGLLEQGRGGTVFIDEVGELPLATQVKLLRVLEDRRVRRIGAREEREVDVRFVAATNRDLEVEVVEGRFRRDLYFRLAGFTIRIPPLRERADEILPLARSFLVELCKSKGREIPRLEPALEAALLSYAWPGNVRELKAIVRRLLVVSDGEILRERDLPHDELFARRSMLESDRPSAPSHDRTSHDRTSHDGFARDGGDGSTRRSSLPGPDPARRSTPPSDFPPAPADERERILAALDQTGGNQTEASKLLGISRRTLIARLDKLGISGPRKRR